MSHWNRANLYRLTAILVLGLSNVILLAKQYELTSALKADRNRIDQLRADFMAHVPLTAVPSSVSTSSPIVPSASGCSVPQRCGETGDGRDSGGEPAQSSDNVASTSIAATLRSRLGFDGGQGLTLAILFSPTDCPACLLESAVWERLHSEFASAGGLAVIGIADRTTVEEMQRVRSSLRISMPLFIDTSGVLRGVLRISDTPYKILIDPSGQVVHTDGPHTDVERQKEFETHVRSLLNERLNITVSRSE